MSVEASCRKYLDAMASRLAEFYEFDYRYNGATMGDVLAAKDGVEGEDWDFRQAKKNHTRIEDDGYELKIRKGQPLTNIKLPNVFTANEWKRIKKFSNETSDRIHNGSLPLLSNGRPFIIIPHAEFNPDMVDFLKTIGFKAGLFSRRDYLVVKDEDALSEGSSFME